MMKQEIVEKISKYFKLTQFEAEKIYDDIFQSIMQGVKEDNISEVTNLGEFIVKYNNNSGYKKTVEFLPGLSLEEEINQRSFEEQRTFTPAPLAEKHEEIKTEQKQEMNESAEPVKEEAIQPVSEQANQTSDSKVDVESEIRRKREEILSKITTPKEESAQQYSEKETTIPPVVSQPELEETHEKSFSDYFSEVKRENVSETASHTTVPPVENVIPPSAVELHNQITGEKDKNINYQPAYEKTYSNGNRNGNGTAEHYGQDNSYYIWYKESEPNISDTQTMSYEYELLYQATKEAEYKSKLRIYVTTFILFFSVVLLLLILSPVIYKYFFTPAEEQTEEIQQETSSNGIEPKQETPSNNNQASVNSLPDNTNQQNQNNQNNNSVPQVTEQQNTNQNTNQQNTNQQSQQQVTTQQQPKQEQPKEQTQQPVTQPQTTAPQQNIPKIDGVTKNAMGWMDEKNKVIYVQLENGKFTIQESAWDSDAKANKRISVVGGIIPGLKGNVVKVDLGTKGTWFRARFGEFSTIEEARVKAEELRNKEKTRLHALLLSFLLYA